MNPEPDPSPAPADLLTEGCALVETLCAVLRGWPKASADTEKEPIGLWLTRFAGLGSPEGARTHRDYCAAFAAFLTGWLNRFRFVTWYCLVTVPQKKTWAEREPGPLGREVWRVDSLQRTGGSLRYARPLRLRDVSSLLDKECRAWKPESNSALRVTVAILKRALESPGDWSPQEDLPKARCLEAMRALSERANQKFDPFTLHENTCSPQAGNAPYTPEFALVFHDLFAPDERPGVWGVASEVMRARLKIYEHLAAPFVPPDHYRDGLDALDWLRTEARRPAPCWALRPTSERLSALGRLADGLLPVVKGGRETSPHRAALVALLTNLARLGTVGAQSLEALNGLARPPGRFAVAGPSAPVAEAVPDPFASAPNDPPELTEFRALVAEARSWRAQAERLDVKDALKAFESLQEQLHDFVLRWGQAGAEERPAERARAVAGEIAGQLLNTLDQIDPLLPGKSENDEALPAQVEVETELLVPLRRTRKKVIDFMTRHGGIAVYPIRVGDDYEDHARHCEKIRIVPDRSGLGPRRIVAVEQPGYGREQNGVWDVKRKPRVVVSS